MSRQTLYLIQLAQGRKAIDPTPDEARVLIDGVFRSYGLDPREATDVLGWRCLSLGSAQGSDGVVEWAAWG